MFNNVFWKSCHEWNKLEKYWIAGQATDDNIVIAFWIPKAIDRQAEYVILIAFQLQEWLHERDSLLRYS